MEYNYDIAIKLHEKITFMKFDIGPITDQKPFKPKQLWLSPKDLRLPKKDIEKKYNLINKCIKSLQ
tara:strand:+ start:952 stop:1149 length:198 start_codon:yes stop_codon:yes gene_type:complete